MLLDTALNLNHRTKKLKDHEEYILKTNIIAESAKLKNQLSQTQKKLSSLNNEIGNKFIKSEKKENELKKHISSLDECSEEDIEILGRIMVKVKEIAELAGITNGYRLVSNCGEDGFQTVEHLHFHLLGGRPMLWPPG